MSPDLTLNCPPFHYASHPACTTLLTVRTIGTLRVIRRTPPARLLLYMKDTRPVHGQYFSDLTPPTTPYYAGNYRGENFICLRHYEVEIPGDPRVGHPAHFVLSHMAGLAADMEDAINNCDIASGASNAILSPAAKLAQLVAVATALFVYFLEIHPYADGNGHAARFILIAALARHGIFLRKWNMHPRPADPPYGAAIAAYRSGNRDMLEKFVLSCI